MVCPKKVRRGYDIFKTNTKLELTHIAWFPGQGKLGLEKA